eukprot:2766947-Rhodomonas_salina.1
MDCAAMAELLVRELKLPADTLDAQLRAWLATEVPETERVHFVKAAVRRLEHAAGFLEKRAHKPYVFKCLRNVRFAMQVQAVLHAPDELFDTGIQRALGDVPEGDRAEFVVLAEKAREFFKTKRSPQYLMAC